MYHTSTNLQWNLATDQNAWLATPTTAAVAPPPPAAAAATLPPMWATSPSSVPTLPHGVSPMVPPLSSVSPSPLPSLPLNYYPQQQPQQQQQQQQQRNLLLHPQQQPQTPLSPADYLALLHPSSYEAYAAAVAAAAAVMSATSSVSPAPQLVPPPTAAAATSAAIAAVSALNPNCLPYHPLASADEFVSVTSANWSNAILAQSQLGLVPKKKTIAQVVIEDQLNSQSLYKTELCRSYEETGVCRYGMKCQFAHGKDELRPVLRHPKYKTEICRTFHSTGTCPYGKRCRFIHQSADESNMGAINLIPWSKAFDDEQRNEMTADDFTEDEDGGLESQMALQMHKSIPSSPGSPSSASNTPYLTSSSGDEYPISDISDKMRALGVSDQTHVAEDEEQDADEERGVKKLTTSPRASASKSPAKVVPQLSTSSAPSGRNVTSVLEKSAKTQGKGSSSSVSTESEKKKSSKRRLAFFARLSGDNSNANSNHSNNNSNPSA